jgi:hypothetical protein
MKTMSDVRLRLAVALAAGITLLAGNGRAAITFEDPTNFQVRNTFSGTGLGSLRSRKTIPADTPAALRAGADPILADLKTFKGQL